MAGAEVLLVFGIVEGQGGGEGTARTAGAGEGGGSAGSHPSGRAQGTWQRMRDRPATVTMRRPRTGTRAAGSSLHDVPVRPGEKHQSHFPVSQHQRHQRIPKKGIGRVPLRPAALCAAAAGPRSRGRRRLNAPLKTASRGGT